MSMKPCGPLSNPAAASKIIDPLPAPAYALPLINRRPHAAFTDEGASLIGGIMIWIVRGAVALAGLFFVAMGLTALFMPAQIAEIFQLTISSEVGRSAIRADLGGFFLGGGLLALAGVVRSNAQYLGAATLLIAIALIGRFIGGLSGGFPEAVIQSMVVEVVLILILGTAIRVLPNK